MRFSKWLMKKGAIGGATRLMIKAYRMQKESNPDVSEREIFRAITKWRYGITGKNLGPVIVGTAARSTSLREYLKYIIVVERYPDSVGLEGAIREVVDEICNESGIE